MSTVSSTTPEKSDELSIAEIFSKFKDKWVAITVTKRDENLQPMSGRIVANDIDRYRLREHLSGKSDVCIFYAGVSPYHLLL